MKRRVLIALSGAVLIGGLAICWHAADRRYSAVERGDAAERGDAIETIASTGKGVVERGDAIETIASTGKGGTDVDAFVSNASEEEEKLAAAQAEKVEAFDAMADKWMESTEKRVTMQDVDDFVAAFRAVPKERQGECIQRALNLVPDENVMLLAGVLMDKSVDKEIAGMIFNDILNRDEEVKKPILQQILRDKSHPCWEDADWLLK